MEELISRPITWSPIQLDNTELKPNDQVEAYEETGEFPSDVEFVELQTDVGWYGRQCRKRLRDQVILGGGLNYDFSNYKWKSLSL